MNNATKYGRSEDMKREIEKDEINKITEHRLCPIREKAFFTFMRQSGLTPLAIKSLRIKNVERILEPDTSAPCKIRMPHEKYPAFIGQEAINYLQRYLRDRARRTKLTPESLLFTIRNNPNKEINTKDVSRTFKLVVQDLARNGKITFEIRRGRPSELRLYSLVKFYRKNASDYLAELNDVSTPRSDEFCRNLYERLAMPSLEIEPPTPIEMHQLKRRQQELENELKKIEIFFPEKQEDEHEKYRKYLEEHPEEARRIQEQTRKQWEQMAEKCEKEMKDDEKWREEHPEEARLRDEAIERYEEQVNLKHFEEEAKVYRDFYEMIRDIVRESRNRAKRHGKTLS